MNQSSGAKRRIELYDTTLRDGTQGEGINLSLVDKLKIAAHLDTLGLDFIEGGYPLSNPKDEAFFAEAKKIHFRQAKLCAFGMTRRKGMKAQNDPGMAALVQAGAPVITIVGKTWDWHVDEVLRVSREENLDMIRESLEFCRQAGFEVIYDAEHFFDGYRANPTYAMQTLHAALAGQASRLILCDTNGGSLPSWIAQVISEIHEQFAFRSPADFQGLGIHCHNDSGLAAANSLAAVEAGCMQVQGTINGIGERCGNTDLTTVAANLVLKMGYDCLGPHALTRLTETSRLVYERANLNLVLNQPFVGSGAFAHKGGMHVHAVQRLAGSYEHVEPDAVGNSRRILVSELSGASNIAAIAGAKFNISQDKALQRQVLERIQDLEHQGYQFEGALASFELLLYELLGRRPVFWKLEHYRCEILKRMGENTSTEAIVKIQMGQQSEHQVAQGDGPVNALDGALRKCLAAHYPQVAQVHLRDYKVRVVNPTAESAAKVRVIADFAVFDPQSDNTQPQRHFSTIGVSENIVDASWQALADALDYHLIELGVAPHAG